MIDQANGAPVPANVPMGTPVPPAADQSWLEVLQQKLNIENFKQQIDLTPTSVVQLSAYFGVGFLGGFLLKRYFLFAVTFTGILIFAVWWLASVNVITFDWLRLHELAGIQSTDTIGTLFNAGLGWVRQNVALSLSLAVGFIFGYKLG